MIMVRGCAFPEHLLCDVENQVWYERPEDGSFRVGRQVEAGRACANADCYGEGWMREARPPDETPIARLISGNALAAADEAWIEAEGFPGCEPRE
jgi:glycine cleavage system H lipoate-binding protein